MATALITQYLGLEPEVTTRGFVKCYVQTMSKVRVWNGREKPPTGSEDPK